MLELREDSRVYLWLGAMDMRIGFDRLALFIKDKLKREVISGGLYVFLSRKRDRAKILYWDLDGYALWFKRLEAGVFRVDRFEGHEEISAVDLKELLRGVELSRIKFRRNIDKHLAAASAV